MGQARLVQGLICSGAVSELASADQRLCFARTRFARLRAPAASFFPRRGGATVIARAYRGQPPQDARPSPRALRPWTSAAPPVPRAVDPCDREDVRLRLEP